MFYWSSFFLFLDWQFGSGSFPCLFPLSSTRRREASRTRGLSLVAFQAEALVVGRTVCVSDNPSLPPTLRGLGPLARSGGADAHTSVLAVV